MMAIKYWEYEDAPIKEKLKKPNVREVAKIFFDNETEAYRMASLLIQVKSKGSLRLKDVAGDLPKSTSKRYLDRAVEFGLLKHEDGSYSITDRYTRPLKNVAAYIKAWSDVTEAEDLGLQFPNAVVEKQQKRGGRKKIPESENAMPV
jgi:hypothetical protein